MQRKIMKMGPSSLVVSLPAEFTSKYKIKKGDEITIINTGDSLVIKTEEEATLGACNINISDYNPIIMRVLGVLYKAGYDEINVKYEPRTKTFNNQNYSELDLIQKSADLYPGMDIISIKNEKALLKENSKIVAEEFDNYLNQAFLNLHQMSMNIYGAVKNSNYSSSQEIDLMEKLLNQNTNFCLRMISKKTYSDFSKTPAFYFIIVNLEQIGDMFNAIYKKSPKVSKEMLKIFEELVSLVDSFNKIHQKFNQKNLIDFAKSSLDLNKKILELKRNEDEFKMMLYNINTRLYDLIEPMLSINHEKLTNS